jgi:hypothetical protein
LIIARADFIRKRGEVILRKKRRRPEGRPLIFNSGAQLVAEVRVVHGVMFLTFAFLMLLVLFGAWGVLANHVAGPSVLLIGIAMHMPFKAITAVFDFFVMFATLMVFHGVIVERDLSCTRGGDEAAGGCRWGIGPRWNGERSERHADQSAGEYSSDFHR